MLKIPQIHAIFFKFAEFGKVRNSLERLIFAAKHKIHIYNEELFLSDGCVWIWS